LTKTPPEQHQPAGWLLLAWLRTLLAFLTPRRRSEPLALPAGSIPVAAPESEREEEKPLLMCLPGGRRVPVEEVEFIHRHELQPHPVTGRWVKGVPYRNPDRAKRLAKSGRLRKDLVP
jgi:hypothetical protein